MYPSTSGRPSQRPQTITSMSPWPAHWTRTTYEPLEPKTILPGGSFPWMLPRAPPIQQDPDKLRVSLKPTSLPRSSDGPTIHPINRQARPLGAVLTSSHPLLPTAVNPSSIPDSQRPDSLYLISSSTIPSSALLSPAWTLGIQSVSPVCPLCGPREVFLPRADLFCSQPFVAPQCPRTRSHPLSPAFKTLCDLVLPTSPRLLYCSPGLAG